MQKDNEVTTVEFTVGDRVRLKEPGWRNWVDHRLQRRALTGTPATVTSIIGTALRANERSYRVEFDAVGRMRPLWQIIHVRDLEAVQQ